MINQKIEKNLSYKITFLNFFFTMCIVIHHLNISGMYQNNGAAKLIINFISLLGYPAMTFFFFTSGFLFFYNLNDFNKYINKLISRIRTLIIPYILWNIITIAVFKIVGISNGVTFYKNMLLINGEGPINGPLWYIFRLVTYIIFISPIWLLIFNYNFKEKYKNEILKYINIFFIFLLIIYNIVTKPSYYSFIYWLPIYLFGGFCSKYYLSFFNNMADKEYKSGYEYLFYISIGVYLVITYFTIDWPYFTLFRYFAVILFFLGIRFINPIKKYNGIFEASFYVYAVHSIFLILIKRFILPLPIISSFANSSSINLLITYIVTFISTFSGILLSYYSLKKISKKSLDLLTGNRSSRI